MWSNKNFLLLCVILIICIACTAESATTSRQQTSVSSDWALGIKPVDSAFNNAGKSLGVEIWRVENFKPVPYPKSDYGKFYTGDSYVILNTKDKGGVKSYDVHFWLGSETSQDEAGSAAILTVQLDDKLGGIPIQYREVQEHESKEFLSLFKSGVRYLPGGVTSGFHHVDRDNHEKKLYQVKGKRNIRVKQVPLSIASMNKGDCFILDTGNQIYVYVGNNAKRMETLKATSAANQIRDQDHGGRPKVIIIDTYSSQHDDFFKALGEGSANSVPDESIGGDDEAFEKSEEAAVTLYKVSDASGAIKYDVIGTKPLLQSLLDTNDCFILDTKAAVIYVWIGKKSNNKEKAQAMSKAENFLKEKKYPIWVQIQRVIEGAEPAVFRQYFKTWKGVGELHSRIIRSFGTKHTPDGDSKIYPKL